MQRKRRNFDVSTVGKNKMVDEIVRWERHYRHIIKYPGVDYDNRAP